MSFTHPSSCSSFHTKCKHGAPSPPVAAALHTPPPPLSLPPLSLFLASYPPSPGRRWQPSRCADTSACRPWYSGVKVCMITQGQGRTIYPIHSLLLGVEINLGREAAPWTLNLYPEPKFIFLPFFPPLPVARWQKVSLSLYLSPSPALSAVRVCRESISWIRRMLPVYICNIQRRGFHVDTSSASGLMDQFHQFIAPLFVISETKEMNHIFME